MVVYLWLPVLRLLRKDCFNTESDDNKVNLFCTYEWLCAIPETEQDDLNDTMVFSPSTITTTLSFVENKFEEGLLSPTGVPQPTMPSLLIPNDSTNRYRSSNSNLHIQDTISTSNSMSNLNNIIRTTRVTFPRLLLRR